MAVFPTFNNGGEKWIQSFGKWTWSWGPSQIQEIPLVPIRTPRSNFIITKSIPEYHHPQIIACSLYLPGRKATSRPYKPLPLSPSVPCLGAPSANPHHFRQLTAPTVPLALRLVTPGYSHLLSCFNNNLSVSITRRKHALSLLRSRFSNLQRSRSNLFQTSPLPCYNVAFPPLPLPPRRRPCSHA